MLTRRLTIIPRPGTAHPSGARVYTFTSGGQLAVVCCETTADVAHVQHALKRSGFVGALLPLLPGQEFTICDVDDGTPSRWQDDGRPSYAALEREVAALRFALEQVAPMAQGAAPACGPGYRVMA